MTQYVTIVEADLENQVHQRDVVRMTAAYALDEMGNGGALPPEVLDQLISGLKELPTTLIFLAYVGSQPAGIATCFRGFSTFAARPLINIHDLAVVPEFRGAGIGRALLEAVERKAKDSGCVKLTLEVLENNHRARGIYHAAGFAQASYTPVAGGALFYSKPLTDKK